MQKRFCLITGANNGIGKEISLALAQAGCHVIMVCRNKEKEEIAQKEIIEISGSTAVDLLIADLSSQAEIRLLAKKIYKSYPALHVLVNNAAVVLPKKMVSVDGIEMTFATNYLAPFLLTNLLLDLLRKSASARIINISSAIHKWVKLELNDFQFEHRKYQFMKAYAQSKLLITIFSFELARRLDKSGVTVNCVHPGAVKTGLGSGNDNSFILKIFDKIIKLFFLSPKAAAKSSINLALSPELSSVTGQYFEKDKPVRAKSLCYDSDLANKLWAISEKYVQL